MDKYITAGGNWAGLPVITTVAQAGVSLTADVTPDSPKPTPYDPS